MGRPVVATAVDGTVEIVRNGVDGALVWSADAAAFGTRVVELLRAPAERAQLGAAAHETVRRRFALDTQVARLARILADAAGRAPRIQALAS
jgi:trehalose synthase